MLDANVGKFSCMSLAYGFMRLVRRENNLEKETLIDIPYISQSINRANTTRVTPDCQIIKHIQN